MFEQTFLIYFTRLPTITPLYVENGSLPDISWEQVTSSYFIQDRKFASRYKVGDTSLTVKDFVSVNTAAACYAWFLSVGDFIGGTLNPPAQYKSDAVYMLTNGQGTPINTWNYHGCWPKSCKFGELKTSGNAIIQIQMEISIDSVSMT